MGVVTLYVGAGIATSTALVPLGVPAQGILLVVAVWVFSLLLALRLAPPVADTAAGSGSGSRTGRQERAVDPVTGLLHYEPVDGSLVNGDAEAVLAIEVGSYLMTSQVVGEDAGQSLLVLAADRVRTAAATVGGRVRRLDGAHLLVLVPSRAEQPLRDLASRLALVPEAAEGGHPAALTVGVAVRPQDGTDVPTLIRSAMVALAHAKREHPGAAVFHEQGMADDARDRFAVARALRTAIDTRDITLVFQPQVDLTTGAVVGVEVLARWRDTARGVIAPTRFVRVAEQIGMSRALDRLIFDKALEQLRLWDDSGVHVPRISVNISPETLRSASVPATIERMLAKHHVAARRVTVELIESRLVDETIGPRVLRELRQVGVRVSLDDFGTGYASFSQLVTLPIDELKIDRSFLSNASDAVTSEAVVNAVVRVAQTLGLDVVAEGVEQVEQQDLLRRLHCPIGQGYLYSPPLTADELVAWLATRNDGTIVMPRKRTMIDDRAAVS